MINQYSVKELNPMPAGYHDKEKKYISWEELKENKNITAERIRFVSTANFPFWDLSYFDIRINGELYSVLNSPFNQVPKKDFNKYIYNILKSEKVFIKNFFDCISKLYKKRD